MIAFLATLHARGADSAVGALAQIVRGINRLANSLNILSYPVKKTCHKAPFSLKSDDKTAACARGESLSRIMICTEVNFCTLP